MTQLNIATLNVQRIVTSERVLQVIDFVRYKDLDIVALQEVCFASIPNCVRDYKLLLNPYPVCGGTAFLCKASLDLKVLSAETSGRIMVGRIGSVSIANIYAPSGNTYARDRKLFFRSELVPYLNGLNRLVMLGDFNAVTRVEDRIDHGIHSGKPDSDLKRVITSFDLTDIWLKVCGTDNGYTRRGPTSLARLDHIYVTSDLVPAVSSVMCQNVSFSDHSCLVCVVQTSEPKAQTTTKVNKTWKLNREVLTEEEYIDKIKCFFKSARRLPLYQSDKCLWWDSIVKTGIKRVTIHYCRRRTQWMHETSAFYESCLTELAGGPKRDGDTLQTLKEIRSAAQKQRTRLHEGLLVRARTPVAMPGEQPSTYHVLRERNIQQATSITSLNCSDGSRTDEAAEIRSIIEEHYTKLLGQAISTDTAQEDLFLATVRHPPLPHRETDLLLAPFTVTELQSALNVAKKGKSPGIDGIPIEFYSAFWDEIANDLVTIFNEIVRRGSLTGSQKQALIRLIPKVPHPQMIEDYRPIALLCTDYKLLASLFKRRLDATLEKVVSKHQRGGIPGRKTEDILLTIRNLVLLLQEKESSGMLVTLDFTKAFDRVNRNTLWQTMVAMGYPHELTTRLESLYVGTTSVISYGVGRQTAPIPCLSSIRQGCPLSVTLFIIYIDPLLCAISNGIEGIRGVPRPVKLAGLVDDVTAFATTAEDLNTIGDVAKRFCQWTGAQLNNQKTKVLVLGPRQPDACLRRENAPQVSWATDAAEVRLLGINFNADYEELSTLNWTTILNRMTCALAASNTRNLSLHQRVRFINQHILSLGAHAAKILRCPKEIMGKITSRILAFIWEGTNLRVAQEAIYRAEKSGGLGLLCPSQFFKTLYVKANLAPLLLESGLPFTQDTMRYWLGFPLRAILPRLFERSRPHKVFECHADMLYLIETVRNLHQDGTAVTPDLLQKGRTLYTIIVGPTLRPGNNEIKHPLLDWATAWEHVRRLPLKLRDFMFRVNHNALHTKERIHRIGKAMSSACSLCGAVETLEHIFWKCPARNDHWERLLPRLQELGVASLPHLQLTHLALPSGINTEAPILLSESYLAIWKARMREHPAEAANPVQNPEELQDETNVPAESNQDMVVVP